MRKLKRPVTLEEIKRTAAAEPSSPLADMMLLKRARLSVQGLTEAQWQAVLALEQQGEP